MVYRRQVRKGVRLVRRMGQRSKADQALRMVKKLNRAIELKRVAYDYINNSGTDPIDGGGVAIPLTPLALGTDGYDRVGEKVTGKFITFRWNVGRNGADTRLRLVVVQHRQSQISNNLILQGASAGVEPLAPYNSEYKTNFTVLYDKLFKVDAQSPNAIGTKRIRITRPTFYNEGSTVPLRGGITAFLFSDASANFPTAVMAWDFAYTDL